MAERDGQLNALNQAVAERDIRISGMLQSHSWRLTRPLRGIGGGIRALRRALGRLFGKMPLIRQARIRRIRQSPLFDADFYAERNPDVVAAGVDLAKHYALSGWKEHRNPSVEFSTRRYLQANPDVAAAGINPLLHYIDRGKAEGRQIHYVEEEAQIEAIRASGLFDADYYFATYPDIQPPIDPIRHYFEHGWHEGRNPSAEFDTQGYLAAYNDVKDAGVNPLLHYLLFGRHESRHANPEREKRIEAEVAAIRNSGLFDANFYAERNPDVVAAGVDLAKHYALSGWKEHRNPSAGFSTRRYLETYPDVATAGINPLLHYVVHGQAEGRQILLEEEDAQIEALRTSGLFDTGYYFATYPDLQPPLQDPIRHYCERGWREGRNPSAEFDTQGYLAAHSDIKDAGINPLWHYWVSRRILVADYRVPRPDVSAGELATVGILRDLCALGYEVVFLPNGMEPSPQYEAALQAVGVQVVTRDSGFDSSAHYLEKHGSEFAAFYLIRVDVTETLLPIARQVAPDARVIFHDPDLCFLREMRGAELRNDPAAREAALQTRDRELVMMRRSDHVVVVSPSEVPVLREMLPGNIPISVFPVLYAPIVDNPRPYAKRKHIFFLGGFGHPPNVDAVQWFAAEVWPHVRKALPEVEFHIIGAEAPEAVLALGQLPGIKVVGFVPELEPVLQTLRVGVAPLQYGAGIKGKVAVTMGAGIPCVCTEIAAEGMGIKNGVHALVEDDPVRFAQAVVTLYQDKKTWTRLARNGQLLVQDKFGDAANRASLLKVLDRAKALPISLFNAYCQSADPVAVPNPDAEADVDVSIIIPVYNKWHITRACLTSIVQTSVGCGVTYEVILADDGSTDETIHAAQIFPGLRVVKTPKNMGFLRNCNHAAKQARGRHILLLNNDTVVLPGWLESLYQTMEQDPSIAIVGSKLLYPDGLIQEAGAAIFNDGTALNVGRGFNRYEEVFNIRREVDYISGASILIRKSFWDSVGGFDERYKNAYCEDSDLAMTARAQGMRVVYEPLSEVVHFEHQSYAEQAPSHNATLQKHNIAILLDKWKHVFEREHLPVCEWPLAASRAERSVPAAAEARRRTGRLNVLYFSPFPSHPPSHGNRSTILQFGQYFQRQGHQVHFVLLQSHEYAESDAKVMAKHWDTFDILPFSNPMLANGREIPFDGWYEEGLGERIRLLCAKYDIDIVFCSYIFQSKILEYVPDYILKVIDTHDKMGGRYEMLRKNGQPLEFFSCTPEEEGAYLRRADMVVARREEEASYFDSVTGRKTAIVVPHVEEPHFLERHFERLKNVGIVASANRINLAIVRESLEAVDRKLGGSACPFTVHIAGQVKEMADALADKEGAIFKRPWVQMHGFVPDIAQFYADMDVVISPVTMGTGINVKTVQAMAYGMPLLTTACGSKGIETSERLHNHENLESLAESLMQLEKSPDELARLACVSKTRYTVFYDDAMKNFAGMLAHPKIQILSPLHADTLLDYQKESLDKLLSMAQIRSLRGKEIMEVGGNGELATAKAFYAWSGRKVTVVTPDPELHPGALDNEKITLVMRGAEESGLPDNSFDLIYGNAILEHIHEYKLFFKEVFRLLKPGGYVLLQGGPHWNSAFGHHVFLVGDGMDYRFTGNNPVPDFAHLYLSEDEMLSELEKRHIPEPHRRAIVQQIYHSPQINRASSESLVDAFNALPWESVSVRKEETQPSIDILERIKSVNGKDDISFVNNLYLAGRKPFILRNSTSADVSNQTPDVPSSVSHPTCKVCGGSTRLLDSVDRGMCVGYGERFPFGQIGEIASYHVCGACGFVFTDFFDAWSAEDFAEKIYNKDYVLVDPDYASARPTQMGRWTADLLADAPRTLRFLDYGAGSGILGDQLRASGFRKVSAWDPFSSPTRPRGPFDVITCYEVLEHVVNPDAVFGELRTLLASGGGVLLSTHLVPGDISDLRSDWWYLGPRNGHISLFSAAALSRLAERHGMMFRTNGKDFHILYRAGKEKSTVPLLMRARADWTGIAY